MPPKAAAIRDDRVVMQKKQKQKQRPQLKTQAQRSTNTPASQENIRHAVPSEIQQSILNVFTQAFPITTQQAEFKKLMQEVKSHLYNRDFLTAFGKGEYLDVYASRWSAARALAYTDIFTHPDHSMWYTHPQEVTKDSKAPSDASRKKEDFVPSPESVDQALAKPNTCMKVVCIGGGAGAEIVALAATNRYLHSSVDIVETLPSKLPSSLVIPRSLHILAVDIADWSEPIRRMSLMLTTLFPSPASTSGTAPDTSRALVDPVLEGEVVAIFDQQDILSASLSSLKEMLQNVALITVMFTLNELFTASLSRTTAFLLNLTEATDVGAHLVVVDSPGSYSEIQIGKTTLSHNSTSTKQYPMKWLLDHTLLEVAGKGDDARWSKVEEDDSKWFRIDQKLDLKYGIDLENCRYQIHVFRKLRRSPPQRQRDEAGVSI